MLAISENDVMDTVPQPIMKNLTGQIVPCLEYCEFFKDTMRIGVPDFAPKACADGDFTVLPAAFSLLNSSLLNMSKVRTDCITCARLVYLRGGYHMHAYTAEAEESLPWNQFGWGDPAPQLPSLQVFPDSCTVRAFSQQVSGRHVIAACGEHSEAMRDLCCLMDIDLII